MGRERFAIVLVLSAAAVLVGAPGCNGERKPAPASKSEVAAPVRPRVADLRSDTVSGCVYGAALVKVLIDLQAKDDRCVPEVTPASVCVAPGGVIRFKIQNGCAARGDADHPALEITKPVFKRPLASSPERSGLPEIFQNCSLRVARIDRGASEIVRCDVAGDALPGFYKYGLTGQIVPLDPDVEVQPGGN